MWDILRRSLQAGIQSGKTAPALPEEIERAPRAPAGEVEVMGQALRVEIQRLYKRSMRLRHMDAGSCNGCESELEALMNPFYDLQRFGLDFVASPRHADALLVTGPPARHSIEALQLTDEAMPRPRLIVAVGDCACHGGFCAGSFATLDGVQGVVPVDIRIPGCPPAPRAILEGLLAGLGRAETQWR